MNVGLQLTIVFIIDQSADHLYDLWFIQNIQIQLKVPKPPKYSIYNNIWKIETANPLWNQKIFGIVSLFLL